MTLKRHRTFSMKYFLIMVFVCTSLVQAKEKNTNVAMLLCLVPGGGQFYTERYVPGTIIGATEIALGYYAYKYHREENFEKRNSLLWWGLFVFGFSLADAYVGAKMYGFDVDADVDKVSISMKLKW